MMAQLSAFLTMKQIIEVNYALLLIVCCFEMVELTSVIKLSWDTCFLAKKQLRIH